MPESVISFQTLPPEYQNVIQLAQEKFGIAISPLQELAGGWSGAVIYLVRVACQDSTQVQHLILKLDRVRPKSTSDEVTRHQTVQENSPPDFVRKHIPDLGYERVQADNALAIFYSIAGQSLRDFRTLSSFRRQKQLERLFSVTNHYLLDEWNAGLTFEQYDHPQKLLQRWLGFRLDAGGKIESFIKDVCRLHPEIHGFIVNGEILPNPLHYARRTDDWIGVRPGDAAVGLQHSDLNTNNILAKFSRRVEEELEGYYLIDFALFKENMPLLYDQRYLEMSYLVHSIEKGATSGVLDLIMRYSKHRILEHEQTPIEVAGINSAISAGRQAFGEWVRSNHPSLSDDLWGQYWLAGASAGLSYCHKAGQTNEIRLAGLIYAAANLKQYFRLFGMPMPAEANQLAVGDQSRYLPRPGDFVPAAPGKIPNNLPASATNFVGRTAQMAEISDYLRRDDVRILTLTGPGGTGKTRLALETGRSMLEQYPHGVYFIDLAGISEPGLVAATAAHTLDIREGGGQPPLETLNDYLKDRETLLIFDNFEQVIDAAADISSLLTAAPGVKALATSRLPLQLRGEQEYPVSPLEMPTNGGEPLEKILQYESMALFRQAARSVQPRFEITEKNYAEVVGICRRLDGLPLAIEIAAARIKMLPPKALLKRLDHSLNLLVGGAKDLPDRQRTLRGAIDWSYELLEPDVQLLFARLGVFAGGFTLEAAEQVGDPDEKTDVFSGIEMLMNNSLMRQVRTVSDEPRFDMLQTIREYALEKAAEIGILDEMRWAHCSFFSNMAGGWVGEGVFGAESRFWLQRFEEEHDNFRLALDWALQHPQEGIQPVVSMMLQLAWFWYRRGYLQEGSEWTERTLQVTEGMGDALPRALALVARCYLALWSGELVIAVQRGQEAVEMSQRLRIDMAISGAKLGYGTALINQGRDKEAYPHLVDAVELYDELDQPWSKGATLVHLANVSLGLGNPKEALSWLDMAKPLLQASGDVWNMAFGLSNYGEVARVTGDYQQAEEYYLRTEQLYKQEDAKGDQARLVHNLGYIALHKGDFEKARALFLESLEDFQKLGNQRGIAECLAGLAGLAVELGEHTWAAPMLSAAESLLFSFDGAWWPADRVEIERAKKSMREALDSQFDQLWQQGQSMNVEEAVAYAMKGA